MGISTKPIYFLSISSAFVNGSRLDMDILTVVFGISPLRHEKRRLVTGAMACTRGCGRSVAVHEKASGDGIAKERFGPGVLWIHLKPLWPGDKPHLPLLTLRSGLRPTFTCRSCAMMWSCRVPSRMRWREAEALEGLRRGGQ